MLTVAKIQPDQTQTTKTQAPQQVPTQKQVPAKKQSFTALLGEVLELFVQYYAAYIPIFLLVSWTVLQICIDYGVPIVVEPISNSTCGTSPVRLQHLRMFLTNKQQVSVLDSSFVHDKDGYKACIKKLDEVHVNITSQQLGCMTQTYGKGVEKPPCFVKLDNHSDWKASNCSKVMYDMDNHIQLLWTRDAGTKISGMMVHLPGIAYTALAVYSHFTLHGMWCFKTVAHAATVAVFIMNEFYWKLPMVESTMSMGYGLSGGLTRFFVQIWTRSLKQDPAHDLLLTCSTPLLVSYMVLNTPGFTIFALKCLWPFSPAPQFPWKSAVGNMCAASLPLWCVLRLYWLSDVATFIEENGGNAQLIMFVARTTFFCLAMNGRVVEWFQNGSYTKTSGWGAASLWIVQYVCVNYYVLVPIENMFLNLYEMSTMQNSLKEYHGYQFLKNSARATNY